MVEAISWIWDFKKATFVFVDIMQSPEVLFGLETDVVLSYRYFCDPHSPVLFLNEIKTEKELSFYRSPRQNFYIFI